MSAARRVITVGARGSLLSVTQATQVIRSLRRLFPGYVFELKTITTLGDRVKDWGRDAKGIFVKEIEDELLAGTIDLAVHSMKDLPSELAPGLKLGAAAKRKDPRDALISKSGTGLMALKKGARVGTTSLRRAAQLLRLRPDLRIEGLRGNLDTRIRKLNEGLYDAIVVARAGLQRLDIRGARFSVIPVGMMLPACGQGVLAIEIRENDRLTARFCGRLNDPRALACVGAEREFLRAAGGGCRLPVAVHARLRGGKLALSALIISKDGARSAAVSGSSTVAGAAALARALARSALDSGGRDILAEIDDEE